MFAGSRESCLIVFYVHFFLFPSIGVPFLAFYTSLKRSLTVKLVFQLCILGKVTSSIVVLLTLPACQAAV